VRQRTLRSVERIPNRDRRTRGRGIAADKCVSIRADRSLLNVPNRAADPSRYHGEPMDECQKIRDSRFKRRPGFRWVRMDSRQREAPRWGGFQPEC
jgi:hypothetical protein